MAQQLDKLGLLDIRNMLTEVRADIQSETPLNRAKKAFLVQFLGRVERSISMSFKDLDKAVELVENSRWGSDAQKHFLLSEMRTIPVSTQEQVSKTRDRIGKQLQGPPPSDDMESLRDEVTEFMGRKLRRPRKFSDAGN